MPSNAVLGATGNLGRHIAGQALARGWNLSVAVGDRSRLPPEIAARAQIADLDLSSATVEHHASLAASIESEWHCPSE